MKKKKPHHKAALAVGIIGIIVAIVLGILFGWIAGCIGAACGLIAFILGALFLAAVFVLRHFGL